MTMDFERWEENIRVSVWGRGKATLVRKDECPEENPEGAAYKGDCDNCTHFMGVRFPKDTTKVTWGSIFSGCCWKKVQP